MQSIKSHFIPGSQGSTYLNLYVLEKEKERLLKEDERLHMRRDFIKKRLEEIDSEVNKLQNVETTDKDNGHNNSSSSILSQKDEEKKDWKKMPFDY
jgi:hypothetical protein